MRYRIGFAFVSSITLRNFSILYQTKPVGSGIGSRHHKVLKPARLYLNIGQFVDCVAIKRGKLNLPLWWPLSEMRLQKQHRPSCLAIHGLSVLILSILQLALVLRFHHAWNMLFVLVAVVSVQHFWICVHGRRVCFPFLFSNSVPFSLFSSLFESLQASF